MNRRTFFLALVVVFVLGASTGTAYAMGLTTGQKRERAQVQDELAKMLQTQLATTPTRQTPANLSPRNATTSTPQPSSEATGTPNSSQRTPTAATPQTPQNRPAGGFQGDGAGLLAAAAIQGQVAEVQGNTIVVTTARGPVSVLLQDTTTIERASPASRQELRPGVTVTVTGSRNESQAVQATRVVVSS